MLIKCYTKEVISKGSANILGERCIISLLKRSEKMGEDGRYFLSRIPPKLCFVF